MRGKARPVRDMPPQLRVHLAENSAARQAVFWQAWISFVFWTVPAFVWPPPPGWTPLDTPGHFTSYNPSEARISGHFSGRRHKRQGRPRPILLRIMVTFHEAPAPDHRRTQRDG